MATDYNLAPVHGINRFLWARLQTAGIMNPNRYTFVPNTSNRYVPITPTQQVATFTEMLDQSDMKGSVPFIIYNWTTSAIPADWFVSTDQIVYLVYSTEEEELRQIVNFMTDLFKRWDQTGKEINDFLFSLPSSASKDRFTTFDYKNTRVLTGGGPMPFENDTRERQEALISISVDYTVTANAAGMRA